MMLVLGAAVALAIMGAAGLAPIVLEVDCGPNPPAGAHTSLAGARDALRKLRSNALNERSQRTPAVVRVSGVCPGPLVLEGELDAAVSWVAGSGAVAPQISGGLQLPAAGFGPVTSEAALGFLPPAATPAGVAHVLQLNLTALGLNASALGELGPHLYPGGDAQIDFFKFTGTGAELFWDQVPLHRARYAFSSTCCPLPSCRRRRRRTLSR